MKRLFLIEAEKKVNPFDLWTIINSYESFIVRLYTIIRFRIIPLRFLQEILQYIPEDGNVLDIGCGFGLFSLYFSQHRQSARFLGVDLSENRIQLANVSVKNLNLANISFRTQDVREINPKTEGKFDAVTAMDVFHHITVEQGDVLLDKIYTDLLTPDGKLILKDVTTQPFFMVWFTFILDLLMNPKDSFYYRNVNRWKEDLSRVGFRKIEEHYLWDVLPYPHILLIAYK